MINFIVRRLVTAVFLLIVLSLLVFAMVRLMPGDPAAQYLGESNQDPEALAAIRQELGLDRPVLVQYFAWVGGMLTGNFGISLTRPFDIGAQIGIRLPASVQLAVLAIIIANLIGIPAGALAAIRSGKLTDTTIRVLSFIALSVPPFVLAAVIIAVNSQTMGLNLVGYTPLFANPFESIVRMLIPATVLALSISAIFARYTRNTLLDTLGEPFIRTARAKGASSSRIVFRHSLRNALVPVSTVVGIQLGTLIGGTIIVEVIFSIPGMGSLLLEAINSTDYPTIQACVMVLGALYILINLVVDVMYPIIDPRIQVM